MWVGCKLGLRSLWVTSLKLEILGKTLLAERMHHFQLTVQVKQVEPKIFRVGIISIQSNEEQKGVGNIFLFYLTGYMKVNFDMENLPL